MSERDELHFSGEEEQAGYAAPLLDLIAAAVLIALAGWYTVEAFGFRAPGDWKTAPGLVPAAAGITLMIMAAGLAVTAWRRRGQAPAAAGAQEDEDSISEVGRTSLLVGIIFLYLLAMNALSFGIQGYVAGHYVTVGSFEIATVVCLSVLMKLFWNGRLWIIAVVALGWTAFLSLTFRNIFEIPLPG
ncbi:tripartite tricarboxylate transporter TctB family protein [Chelativorans sp. M5D2P16]|uniref:tripartite tricarboxylate transporter TctB family protein n=1 Tax=Chelativorans sp. M5D2P16 TaxID=3095678 RepID=UPI002ACA234E|nr:tripartite tricarboxylate transporter TctB family protein [Chelativorans sp. M5D2P16]MDZ5696618.1 tripartite tricarboxylate transporter TctB family protein [Chelativorans sp. M5D2P16]